jgi:hypothetical protein
MSTRHINPEGLHRTPDFSQAIVVPLPRVRAGELRWEKVLYELKSGLGPGSDTAGTGNRPHSPRQADS